MNDAKRNDAGREEMRRVKAHFALRGTTYSQWAVSHGFSKQMVAYVILHPVKRGILAARIREALCADMRVKVNMK